MASTKSSNLIIIDSCNKCNINFIKFISVVFCGPTRRPPPRIDPVRVRSGGGGVTDPRWDRSGDLRLTADERVGDAGAVLVSESANLKGAGRRSRRPPARSRNHDPARASDGAALGCRRQPPPSRPRPAAGSPAGRLGRDCGRGGRRAAGARGLGPPRAGRPPDSAQPLRSLSTRPAPPPRHPPHPRCAGPHRPRRRVACGGSAHGRRALPRVSPGTAGLVRARAQCARARLCVRARDCACANRQQRRTHQDPSHRVSCASTDAYAKYAAVAGGA